MRTVTSPLFRIEPPSIRRHRERLGRSEPGRPPATGLLSVSFYAACREAHEQMDFDDHDALFEAYPTLAGVRRFARLIPNTDWFARVGQPLDPVARDEARTYAAALGFPDAEPAILEDWQDAAAAAETLDLNTPAWEAEAQLRRDLALAAEAEVEPRVLELVMTGIAELAADPVREAAETTAALLGIHDEDFLRAASGGAVQACHQAALVLAAGQGAEHPFSLKFSLYEHGRWPVGIVGASFNIF